MASVEDLVKLTNTGRNFVVYGSHQAVHPVAIGDPFRADDMDVVVGRVNNNSGDLIPNAYSKRMVEQRGIFQLYFLSKDEYERALEIQEMRIAEELLG